jgi:hypothetical protein
MADIAEQPSTTLSNNELDMAKRGRPRRARWAPQLRTQTHPFLFTLMTLTAAAELGLTAFLISTGNETQVWSSGAYRSL